ncbi:hypothetical protein N431DRAFT_550879 [Stipitochalara longipes BDJ]|nr:hypothetical protein N431DRAFT_550879 [Stipitochalara longipes BDJ]
MKKKHPSVSCSVCQIELENNVLQRAHMKTDWHVYNLKRKLTSLPPLTSEVYNQNFQVAQNNAQFDGSINNSEFSTPDTTFVELYGSSEANDNHSESGEDAQAHEKVETTFDPDASLERVTISTKETDSKPRFVPSRCLFCTIDSSTVELNVKHIQKDHGLFIQDQEYLFDLETFLKYLFTVITEFYECLYCGKTKDSAIAIRQHMISKGHCNLKPEAGSEYEDFYDIESDGEKGSEGEVEGSSKAPEILVPIDNELHLPSGRTLGHRSQARYYRQNKITTDKSAERKAIEDSPESSRAAGIKSKQLATRNAMGMIGVPELKKRALGVFEKKMMKRQVRAQNQYRAAVEKGANKQKFFKPDVPGPING